MFPRSHRLKLPIDRWSPLQRRAVGAYLGLALGDALGATVEFMLPNEIRSQHGIHDKIIGGGWLHLKPGQVTDDTGMALALGEAILESGGEVRAEAVARAFDRWMQGKPVDIGNTVRRGIMDFRLKGLTEVACDAWDAGNGACMRTLPVALAYRDRLDADMVAASRAQAHVTHHNPLSDAACEAINRMVILALKGEGLAALVTGPMAGLVAQEPLFRYKTKRPSTNPSAYIVDTIKVVFQGFYFTDNFTDCLVETVNRGGDADTTGAIAGMVAGAHYGVEAIPGKWLSKLDPGIREACIAQALALTAI